ncbi:hypothetical protein HanIR_Chr05g0246201 [Helianthus annuus]|nr:hypothetical protein HanIR_Chr05g0246201 [Helianthus annuus]
MKTIIFLKVWFIYTVRNENDYYFFKPPTVKKPFDKWSPNATSHYDREPVKPPARRDHRSSEGWMIMPSL